MKILKFKMLPTNYAQAGVDIEKREKSLKNFLDLMKDTFKFNKNFKVLGKIGLYANLIEFGEYGIALTTDGVGTKVLVAQELDKYDTIGIDMIAMNVNDLICVGAEPVALVDYIAMQYPDEKILNEIGKGIYEGAKQANIAVIGGETAIVPDIIKGINNKGFDLSGTAIGIVKKDKIITGEKVSENDVIIGLKSSGIHSNGLTLARKVLPKKFYKDLLIPTKIYVKEIMEILKNYEIYGLVNITGGGFRNFFRVGNGKFGFFLDNVPSLDEQNCKIFEAIQNYGKISDEEMYKTFNMGIGFAIITNEKNAKEILKEYDYLKIGKIIKERKIKILKKDKVIEIKPEKFKGI